MIKEMNLTAHDSQEIEGVNNVPVNQLQIISNGYVEKMTCYCLDNLIIEDRNKVFSEAIKKVKVGGVMNLAFMTVMTVFMILEKIPDYGKYISKPLSLILIASGTVLVWF